MSGKDNFLKAMLGGTDHIAEKSGTYNSPTYGPNQKWWVMNSGDKNHGHYNPNSGYYRGSDGYVWNKGKKK